MGNAFCFCDKNDPNLIKGDINIGENQPDNNNSNKLKNNQNDKKNPESCTYSNSNHRNENENEVENENEIDDNAEENEEENNNENDQNSNQEEEKGEESEINDENINNDKEHNMHTEIEKLQNINIFKGKIKQFTSEVTETQFEEAIPETVQNIEKNLENLDQNHEKIQELLKKINQQTNISFPPIKFNDSKMLYMGMWNISGIKEGYGIMLDSKGNKYQGGWLNDLFEGWGRLISVEGDW